MRPPYRLADRDLMNVKWAYLLYFSETLAQSKGGAFWLPRRANPPALSCADVLIDEVAAASSLPLYLVYKSIDIHYIYTIRPRMEVELAHRIGAAGCRTPSEPPTP